MNWIDSSINFPDVLDSSKRDIRFLYRKDGSVVGGVNRD
jgi:hypothetical protein